MQRVSKFRSDFFAARNADILEFAKLLRCIPGISRRAILDCCAAQYHVGAERIEQILHLSHDDGMRVTA